MFEADRGSLVYYVEPLDGFHCVPALVSKACIIRFDTTEYRFYRRPLAALRS